MHTRSPVKPSEFETKVSLHLKNAIVRGMFAGQSAYKVSRKTI
jgi:hypothetical protein